MPSAYPGGWAPPPFAYLDQPLGDIAHDFTPTAGRIAQTAQLVEAETGVGAVRGRFQQLLMVLPTTTDA